MDHSADHVDGLLEGVDRLARRAPWTADRPDRVPEATRTEAELNPSARQQIGGSGLLGDDRRAAQRQVGHIGKEPDPLGSCGQPRDQRERVEEAPLVRMVLDADQVETELIREPHRRQKLVDGVRVGTRENAELQSVRQ